jgi:hypothetical protein
MASETEKLAEVNPPAGYIFKFSHPVIAAGCYIIERDANGSVYVESNTTIYSAKLTPIEGMSFDLTVMSYEHGRHGRISLKNCGPVTVRFLKFRLAPHDYQKQNFELEPYGSVHINNIFFKDYFFPQSMSVKFVCEMEVFIQLDLEFGKKFITDIGKMKDVTLFADGVLICQNQEIECHRVVLAARSEHFRNMFANTAFVEGQSQRIEVKGMDLSTLQEMLSFIYTNEFNEEKADISSLFSAADQYQILSLVSKCESLMIQRLSIENAAEFFYKSFLHESAELKLASMDFIFKNFEAVKATDGWAEVKRNPLSSEALELVLNFVMKN